MPGSTFRAALQRFCLFLSALLALGADDPWTKVRELRSGVEIRVYKTGAKQPVTGKLDQATDESVILVTKKEEISIGKEDIDRIEYRNDSTAPRIVKGGDSKPDNQSGSLTVHSKPGFETVYSRAK